MARRSTRFAPGIQHDTAAFFRHEFLPPFYGVGGTYAASNDVIEEGVSVALTAGMKGLIEEARCFSFGDFADDIPALTVPTLLVHGTEDIPVPIEASARRAAAMLPEAELIEYEGHPHGFCATHGMRMAADTLEFVRS